MVRWPFIICINSYLKNLFLLFPHADISAAFRRINHNFWKFQGVCPPVGFYMLVFCFNSECCNCCIKKSGNQNGLKSKLARQKITGMSTFTNIIHIHNLIYHLLYTMKVRHEGFNKCSQTPKLPNRRIGQHLCILKVKMWGLYD